ncbi:Hypothetical protein PHPALM_7667, partial [Phytophthora palmivora]
MWCSFLRDNVAHLGNSTNNRLESSWPKIKTIVDRDVDLDEAVTSLIWWARYKEKQFTTDLCRVGRVVDTVRHTNPELARLAQIVSKHAKLPCRHVMYLRNLLKLETVIPFGYIPDRWCFNSETMLQQIIQEDFD